MSATQFSNVEDMSVEALVIEARSQQQNVIDMTLSESEHTRHMNVVEELRRRCVDLHNRLLEAQKSKADAELGMGLLTGSRDELVARIAMIEGDLDTLKSWGQ